MLESGAGAAATSLEAYTRTEHSATPTHHRCIMILSDAILSASRRLVSTSGCARPVNGPHDILRRLFKTSAEGINGAVPASMGDRLGGHDGSSCRPVGRRSTPG